MLLITLLLLGIMVRLEKYFSYLSSYKLLLLGLTYLEILIANNFLELYNVSRFSIKSGLFTISYLSLSCQLISVGVTLWVVFNSIKSYQCKEPVRILSTLSIKVIKSIDFSLFIPGLGFVCEIISNFYDVKLNILSGKEADDFIDNMKVTLQQLLKINSSIEKIKLENRGLELIINKHGILQIEVSSNSTLSETELSSLRDKVGIADRVYNTQLAKYNDLVSQDIKHNQGICSRGFKSGFDNIQEKHNKLFTIEK